MFSQRTVSTEEVANAPRGSEPPDESQQSDCYGPGCVAWNKRDSRFEARIRFKSDGKQHFIGASRPKDGSAKELERARQAARDAIERRRRDPNYKHRPSLDEIALCKAPPEYDADESLDMHVRCNKARGLASQSEASRNAPKFKSSECLEMLSIWLVETMNGALLTISRTWGLF